MIKTITIRPLFVGDTGSQGNGAFTTRAESLDGIQKKRDWHGMLPMLLHEMFRMWRACDEKRKPVCNPQAQRQIIINNTDSLLFVP